MGKKGGLFRYADGVDKLLMVFGTLGSIGDGLMTPLTMFVLSRVINEYGAATLTFSNDIVDEYSLKLLIVAIGVGISAFIEGFCWTRTAERQTSRMRMEYLKSVLRQEVAFFDSQANSSMTFQIISTISSDAHLIQDTIAEKLPNCLAHLSSFMFCIPVAFILSWRLALAALPFSVMIIIPGLGFGKVMQNLGVKMHGAYGVAGGIAEQAFSSIRTVYSYVGEHQTLKKFSIALEKATALGIKQGFTKGLLIGSMGMIYAAWAFQAWVGSKLVTERGEKGGLVFVSGICVILGGLAIMSALPNLSFITEASTAATRISEMIDRVPVIDSENEKGKVLQHVKGDIEFRKVEFFYPSRPETPILQGLSLKVQAGKMLGLVGSSGSGKSTIISLLERFYDPVKGEILLDGHKLKKFQLHWLRSQMGLVNQEPILFATSILENILFGKEGASMEDVTSAAKAANAHDFIVKLPAGYHTQVGQFGVQLSGGQKQRISIARAIIRDPKILLLDEATSALDAQSETIVQEALDQASQGRTTIVIAHRLSTIRKADMIVVLQSGRVVEKGSHNELVNVRNGEGGAYKKMLQLQQQALQSSNPNKIEQPQTPQTPRGLGPSWQNSPGPLSGKTSWHTTKSVHSSWQNSPMTPAYAVTPIFSISIANSIQTPQYGDFDDEWSDEISKTSSSQWRLFQMNSPEWKQAILGCLGAAGFGTLQTINAYCLGTVVSIYYKTDDSAIRSQIRFYCYIFLGIAGFSFLTSLLQHYNFAVMGERLSERVRTKLLEKILTFEIGWFDQDENTSAAICARLTTEANIVRSLTADRISLLVQVFFSAAIAYTLALIVSWRIATVMIAIQPLLIGSFYSRSVLMTNMSRKARKAQAVGSQLASEATFNHRTITAFSSQTRILNLFQDAMQGPRNENIKQSWVAGIGLFSSQFVTTAAIALTYWYGGRLMNQNLVSSTHLFQVFFILMSTGKNIADAGSMTSDIARSGKAITSIFAILDRESEISSEELKGVKKSFKGHIDLKNVVFSYPVRPDQMIFKGLNLKIKAGNTMALVGQSGSGKSTVIGLIERFYEPLSGSVFMDGCDIKQYNLKNLRSQIALVSQEPTLFGGTIHENIIYGKENATVSEVRKAAKQANAHEFISSMESGYDTYCGERGVQLSGGQKQRIALARAILKNPSILLLDEATSALDSVSENLVQEALEKMMVGRTCVVVAHRLSTIQKADSIAVITNGKVAEQGSHSELVSVGSGGAYYSLIKLQSNQAISARTN
ncbi:hypothetical protein ACLB2K_034320 [Fragaria x ananassa]